MYAANVTLCFRLSPISFRSYDDMHYSAQNSKIEKRDFSDWQVVGGVVHSMLCMCSIAGSLIG